LLNADAEDAIMNHVFTATALVLTIAAGAAAQTTKVKSQTEIEVKDGKDVTLTGCVARSASGTAYLLNDVEGENKNSRSYILVGDVDLDNHIGHLVEIKGKASDLGDDAKIEVKTKTEVERDDADDKETETKTTLEGDLAGVPYLGVKSVKMVRSSCS
jgi:hypothetical protein